MPATASATIRATDAASWQKLMFFYNIETMSRAPYLGEFEEIVLLAVARLGDEAYGMRVRREIEARTGRAVSIGAVYATLERLADKTFVRRGVRPHAPGRRGSAAARPGTASYLLKASHTRRPARRRSTTRRRAERACGPA